MKQRLRSLLFLALSLSLLTINASADMGPKSQLIVRVKHAPDELYYLDLLAEGYHTELHNDLSETERALLDTSLHESLRPLFRKDGTAACLRA